MRGTNPHSLVLQVASPVFMRGIHFHVAILRDLGTLFTGEIALFGSFHATAVTAACHCVGDPLYVQWHQWPPLTKRVMPGTLAQRHHRNIGPAIEATRCELHEMWK